MRKTKLFVLLLTIIAMLCFFTACGEKKEKDNPPQQTGEEIVGVTFNDADFVYDGEEKSIVAQNLPDGVTATYTQNKGTDAGTYSAKATLSGEGYKTLVLNATLTIDKADIVGATFEGSQSVYDGDEKTIIAQNLPDGVTATYSQNKGTDAGTYSATATLSGANYNTLSLNATLTIDKADIVGATFEGSQSVYDGEEKTIVAQNLPDGVTATYSQNKGTDAGTYSATATLSGANYNTLSLNATLTIDKADIEGVTIDDQEVKHDGENHMPVLSGTLPQGVTAKFFFDEVERSNGVNAVGNYELKVEISGKNFKTLILNCSYAIKMDYLGLAKSIVDTFGSVPDVWSFLPDSFSSTSRTIATTPDYTNFAQVSTLPKNGMGKQLNMVYGVMTKTSTAMGYVNQVYAVLNTIQTLYQTYLNNNPTDYKNFSGTAGGFAFSISLTEKQYLLTASISSVNVEIYSNIEDESYGARIQLASNTALKYEVDENYLKVAINILNSASTQLEFIKNNNKVVGYIYEYAGAVGVSIVNTSAYIDVGTTYTTMIGTKGDFIPTSGGINCEIYRNSDGNLVGTEVRETVKSIVYNTLWYNLYDIAGIDSIKKIDESNGLNADTIYINNSTDTIHTKTIGTALQAITNPKALSRRFDIEFKTQYFYTYNATDDTYESVTAEIPMMFIQEENLSTFETDFSSANDDSLSGPVSLATSQAVKNAVAYGYTTLLPLFEDIKTLVTQDAIIDYID